MDAPPEAVFRVVSDHAGYARLDGVTSAAVLEPGRDDANGVGCLRRVVVDGLTFVERIVAFEAPHVLGYRVESCRPVPLRHEHGEVRVAAEGRGSRVVWTSTFAVDVPVLGPLLTPFAARGASKAFGRILRSMAAAAERSAR